MIAAAEVNAAVSHLEVALSYTRLGWFVVPACWPDENGQCACPKRSSAPHNPEKEVGKAPWLGGYQDLRPDEEQVRAWWTMWPQANIAVLLKPSGLVDIAPDSPRWWKTFQERGLPKTAHAVSGGGEGHLHYFYRRPASVPEHRICRTGEFDLLTNGVAILPPSRHVSGRRYGWLVSPEDLNTLPVVPLWAVDMLRGSVRAIDEPRAPMHVEGVSTSGEPPVPLVGVGLQRWRGELVEGKADGTVDRSDSLFEIGRVLARAGATKEQILEAVAERDSALGWDKFTSRRDAREYARIAQKAADEVAFPQLGAAGLSDSEQHASKVAEPTALYALTAEDLFPAQPKPVPWLIHEPMGLATNITGGLLAERNLFVLGANSGIGKTWVWLDLAIALPMGLDVLHYFKAARPLRLMLVDEESSLWLLQRRMRQLLAGRGLTVDDYLQRGWPNVRFFVDQAFSFDSPRALEALRREAEAFQPDVVIFDSLSRIHRRPENDNSEMAALFEDRIKPFSRDFNTCLGFAHHTRKPSAEGDNAAGSLLRGASDLRAQLDQFWFLRGRENVPKVIFEHDKCRPAQALPPFTVIREDTEDGGVVVRRMEGAAARDTATEQAEDIVLAFLIEKGPIGRSAVLEFCKGRGIGQRTMDGALKNLYDQDEIAKTRDGKEVLYSAVRVEL